MEAFLRTTGCDSLVVKVMDSWLACHEFEPGAAEDPPCKKDRYTLNLSGLKRPPIGVEVRREGLPAHDLRL
ncbi:hypothetical protein TNCV_2943081 [Trichonephila clavipes]|nr:hypothetical protein TNCV_2943081 [Trichonephila clavipes]